MVVTKALLDKIAIGTVQFGVDYFPRTRGVSTLSSPGVIVKILREAFKLRKKLNAIRPSSLNDGLKK